MLDFVSLLEGTDYADVIRDNLPEYEKQVPYPL